MPRLLLVFSSVLLFNATTPPAYAWGKIGHAVTADIAEARLNARARTEVETLLAVDGDTRLAQIASWADEVKADHLPGSPSHTIRLPIDGSDPQAHPCPGYFCADDALARYGAILADPRYSDTQREIALKYVVHLVGDLQQPLHDVDATGSHIPVGFDGQRSSLHKVWDSGIIEAHGGTPSKIARELAPLADRVSADGTPMQWAIEGRDIARVRIYDTIAPKATTRVDLAPDYAARQWPVVATRLAQGGVRLAALLNRLLGSS